MAFLHNKMPAPKFGILFVFSPSKLLNKMKKTNSLKTIKPIITLVVIILLASCLQDQTPTKTKMEGVWKVTSVTDATGDITSSLAFPVILFQLNNDGTVISTAGPLIMYVVYGHSKFTQIAADIDQVFDYATLNYNGGEFFVGGGVVDRFTLEMKLEGLPGQGSLTTLLNMLGVTQDYLDVVIYHKFMNIQVAFDVTGKQMTWTIDDQTTAVYNKKDSYGNYILWQGWPVSNFSKCTITLQKKSTSLNDLVAHPQN